MPEAGTEASFSSRKRFAFALGPVLGCAKGEIAELIAVVIEIPRFYRQPVSAAADSYDPPARVARLSYSRGSVSFQPAGDSEWVDAVLNLPIVTGDNLWAGENSRAEVRIGSKAIRLDHDTEISFLTITDHRIQLTACFQYVACGLSIAFLLASLAEWRQAS